MKLSQIFTIGLFATGLTLSIGQTVFAASQDDATKTSAQTEIESSEKSTNTQNNQSKPNHSRGCNKEKHVSS